MKKLLLWASITCVAAPVFATVNDNSESKIKLEGFFGFQCGYSNQSGLLDLNKNISDNKKKFAFSTDAAIFVTASQDIDNVVAGAKIILMPSTKVKGAPNYNGSHIFLETEYGKVELGSPHDVTATMSITGGSIAGGGGWSSYVKLDGKNMQYMGLAPSFATASDFYTGSFVTKFSKMNDKTEPARKISYYTPKINGVQLGISYTPDSANTGGGPINNRSSSGDDCGITKAGTGINKVVLESGEFIMINQNVKDAVSAGISYEYEILDDVALKVAATGEYGKAVGYVTEPSIDKKTEGAKHKLSDLKAYNLGAVLTYGNFSYAASYGSLGKSLTAKEYHKTGRNTRYYEGAIAYSQGPMKTSVSYSQFLQYKNTLNAISVSTEYKMIPGLVPYVTIAYIPQAKGKPVYYPDAPKKKTKATIALIGAKLKF